MITITDHNFDLLKRKLKGISRDWDNKTIFSTAHIDILYKLCREVDSKYAQSVIRCLDNNDYDQLLSLELDHPRTYMFSSLYRDDTQIRALISKYPYWDIKADPKLESMKKFIACEAQCRETNIKIMHGSLNRDRDVAAILNIAQRTIAQILGDCPSVEDLAFEFGPGSAFSVKNNTTALDKLESSLDVTPNCYGLARKFLLTCPGWHSNDDCCRLLNVVHGDRLAFVPKTALIHRPIGINALLNSLIQKGIGKCIRERLKPVINLSYAQDKHRLYALKSSVDQRFATIDLASASDTISYMIVLDLLPPQWFELLDSSRSPQYSIDGKTYSYEKFSAMGNGYTFELETLLFYAIADACQRYMDLDSLVSVYGDDLIVPSQCAPLVIKVLTACGFSTNVDKTFLDGPFRESCGGDYFNGYDVRPFYLKGYLTYRTIFLLHNFWAKKGWNYIYPKTFRLIRKLIGKSVIKLLSCSETTYDGIIYDPSLPRRSFFYISTKNAKRTRKVDNSAFSKAYSLYRIMDYPGFWYKLHDPIKRQASPDIYHGRKRLRYKLSFHRHI